MGVVDWLPFRFINLFTAKIIKLFHFWNKNFVEEIDDCIFCSVRLNNSINAPSIDLRRLIET